jgi:hypothetical protein
MIRRIPFIAAAISTLALGGSLLFGTAPADAIVVTPPPPPIAICIPIPNDATVTTIVLVPQGIAANPAILLEIGACT